MLTIREQYDMSKHGKIGVLRFMDELLKLYSTAEVCKVYGLCQELTVPVKVVKEAENPQVRLRELQLQAICRLILMTKKEKKNMLKELHSIFSSIALLCDTLEPPCITDEDAVSPFRCFLQNDIASRFSSILPKTTTYLLSEFELLDKSNENSVPREEDTKSKVYQVLHREYVLRKQSNEHVPPKMDSKNLLSQFLNQEKHPKKRSRRESDDSFKEMPFSFTERSNRTLNLQMNPRRSDPPHIEKKRQCLNGIRIYPNNTVTKCDARNKSTANARKNMDTIIPFKHGVGAMTYKKRGDTRRALQRDRQTTNIAKYSKNTTVTTSEHAIILRTPERPLRNPPRMGRILVESSPPLRQPTHSLRKPKL